MSATSKANRKAEAEASKAMLNAKQALFVLEYLRDLNATEAAKRAGYSDKTAYSQGQRLLKHVEVAAAIERAMGQRAERLQVDADNVVRELARIGMADVRKLFGPEGQLLDITNLDDDIAAAVASVDLVTISQGREEPPLYVRKIKLNDKVAALDKLMRHLGAYAPEKVEVTNIADAIWDARRRARTEKG